MGRAAAPKQTRTSEAAAVVSREFAAPARKVAADSSSEDAVKKDVKMQVSAVRSGTVVDHLAPGTAMKTLALLGLPADATVLIGVNLDSRKLGKKDLLKIEGRELTQQEIDKVALISTQATFSIVRDFEVVKKIKPDVPDVVEGLVRCVNPACVTQDPRVTGRFHTVRKKPLKLRCHFCERSLSEDEIEFV